VAGSCFGLPKIIQTLPAGRRFCAVCGTPSRLRPAIPSPYVSSERLWNCLSDGRRPERKWKNACVLILIRQKVTIAWPEFIDALGWLLSPPNKPRLNNRLQNARPKRTTGAPKPSLDSWYYSTAEFAQRNYRFAISERNAVAVAQKFQEVPRRIVRSSMYLWGHSSASAARL